MLPSSANIPNTSVLFGFFNPIIRSVKVYSTKASLSSIFPRQTNSINKTRRPRRIDSWNLLPEIFPSWRAQEPNSGNRFKFRSRPVHHLYEVKIYARKVGAVFKTRVNHRVWSRIHRLSSACFTRASRSFASPATSSRAGFSTTPSMDIGSTMSTSLPPLFS